MNIKNEAIKDAKKYAKAQMNYGAGAGINRRHVKAELERKLENPSYRREFESALDEIDYGRIVRDIKIKNRAKDSVVDVKRAFKKVVKAGAVTAGGMIFYINNKEKIDQTLFGLKLAIKNRINKRKYKGHTKIVNMTDAQKAAAYLRSQGINVTYE